MLTDLKGMEPEDRNLNATYAVVLWFPASLVFIRRDYGAFPGPGSKQVRFSSSPKITA